MRLRHGGLVAVALVLVVGAIGAWRWTSRPPAGDVVASAEITPAAAGAKPSTSATPFRDPRPPLTRVKPRVPPFTAGNPNGRAAVPAEA
jgi:hypothetical protein